MSNVRVKSIGASFNGLPVGAELELTHKEAGYYASIGYVEILPEEKPAKQESAPKAESPSGKDADKPKAPRKRASKDDK